MKKLAFSKRDLLLWKVPARQAVLGSSDQRKVPAGLSVFLKAEKIPTLLYVRKGPEYRLFSYTNCTSNDNKSSSN
jgi:hypothetical protein